MHFLDLIENYSQKYNQKEREEKYTSQSSPTSPYTIKKKANKERKENKSKATEVHLATSPHHPMEILWQT
ncbi:uncharacterized protein VTP21DRAFT_10169 [Calcarisporiella thermophila]|uniref:uncharacterized protein n=1 Tax=Calcarisporiella thermophila TaxID=911321 RepID=UPI003742DA44